MSLVTSFENKLKTLDHTNVSMVLEAFKATFSEFGTATSKPVRKSRQKASEGEKEWTWARLWTSVDYGGKRHFPEDYESIKKTDPKMPSFKILSLLRDRLEAEEGRPRWQKWYKDVTAMLGEKAPKKEPTDRLKVSETKLKPADKPTDKPKPADKPTDQPADKPTDKPKPADKPTDKPVDKSVDKPKPADKSVDKPKPVDKPDDELMDDDATPNTDY